MENKSSSKESPTEKRHWFLSKGFLIPVTIVTILGGWVGGFFLVNNMNAKPPIDSDEQKINYFDNKALAEVNKYNALSASQKQPENIIHALTPAELVNSALYTTGKQDNFQGITIGEVKADAVFFTLTQLINSYSIKQGDKGFFETLASSFMINIANRFYSENAQSKVVRFKGDYHGDPRGVALWNKESTEEYTKIEYEKVWGCPLDRPLLYLICNDLILKDETKPSTASYDSVNHRINVELNLSPIDASLRYVRQMRTLSDLDEYPVFETINLKFSIFEDLKVDNVKIDETYTAKKFGVNSPSHGMLTKTFKYENKDIPDLDTNCDYKV